MEELIRTFAAGATIFRAWQLTAECKAYGGRKKALTHSGNGRVFFCSQNGHTADCGAYTSSTLI